jgi:hypothetical protein
MKDLSHPLWMKLKALLFLIIGIACAVFIYLENPVWRTVVYLALMIWSFCRLYYFAFYVIEKYIDPTYKFSGLYSAIKYLFHRRR